ncbi:hypothetical protein F5883DRAFT_538922 [Diaporthe sp. PMI_573]|nr:hypothetical protein F5883DRAFT_538922 [Diaporthaceae sp. PMI_573]
MATCKTSPKLACPCACLTDLTCCRQHRSGLVGVSPCLLRAACLVLISHAADSGRDVWILAFYLVLGPTSAPDSTARKPDRLTGRSILRLRTICKSSYGKNAAGPAPVLARHPAESRPKKACPNVSWCWGAWRAWRGCRPLLVVGVAARLRSLETR